MRVNSFTVENFRCFEKKTFVFHEPFTILIGDNGVGKSALLDALSVGLGSALRRLVGTPPKLGDEDVRQHRFNIGEIGNVERQFPVVLDVEGSIDERWFRHAHTLLDFPSGKHVDDDASNPLVAEMAGDIRRGSDRTVPVVAYYGTRRGRAARPSKTKRSGSRLDGYVAAFDADAELGSFTDWLRQRTGQGFELGRMSDDLRALLNALEVGLPDWNGVRFDFTNDDLVGVRVDHGEETERFPFRLLSDGQRSVLGLMCDLAYRCVVLNPQLGLEAVSETPGVVLVDELDLHLHPKWQRTIVDDLRAAFPRVQFISTTHSPMIVQTLPSQAVVDLSSPRDPAGLTVEPETTDFRRESYEDIVETNMGVENPQWSRKREEWSRAAHRYFDLLERQRGARDQSAALAEAKRELDLASEPFSADAGFAAWRALIAARNRA